MCTKTSKFLKIVQKRVKFRKCTKMSKFVLNPNIFENFVLNRVNFQN